MKTFITQVQFDDGAYAGPELHAMNWQEANALAARCTWKGQAVEVIGELAG